MIFPDTICGPEPLVMDVIGFDDPEMMAVPEGVTFDETVEEESNR